LHLVGRTLGIHRVIIFHFGYSSHVLKYVPPFLETDNSYTIKTLHWMALALF